MTAAFGSVLDSGKIDVGQDVAVELNQMKQETRAELTEWKSRRKWVVLYSELSKGKSHIMALRLQVGGADMAVKLKMWGFLRKESVTFWYVLQIQFVVGLLHPIVESRVC